MIPAALDAAIVRLAAAASGGGPGPWGHLTCIEVNAIRDVLLAGGQRRAADMLIEEHSKADYPGDEHYNPEWSDPEAYPW